MADQEDINAKLEQAQAEVEQAPVAPAETTPEPATQTPPAEPNKSAGSMPDPGPPVPTEAAYSWQNPKTPKNSMNMKLVGAIGGGIIIFAGLSYLLAFV